MKYSEVMELILQITRYAPMCGVHYDSACITADFQDNISTTPPWFRLNIIVIGLSSARGIAMVAEKRMANISI